MKLWKIPKRRNEFDNAPPRFRKRLGSSSKRSLFDSIESRIEVGALASRYVVASRWMDGHGECVEAGCGGWSIKAAAVGFTSLIQGQGHVIAAAQPRSRIRPPVPIGAPFRLTISAVSILWRAKSFDLQRYVISQLFCLSFVTLSLFFFYFLSFLSFFYSNTDHGLHYFFYLYRIA